MLTSERLVQRLIKSGLLSVAEVNAFLDSLPPGVDAQDAGVFARRLVNAGKLTRFQAERLLQGRGRTLVIEGYVLLERLGGGGGGEVFKAKHLRLGRLAAIKVLSADSLQSPEAIQRFQKEVRLTAQFRHPNVVLAYDAGVQDGAPYLVMEYVDGRDLSSYLTEYGPLPLELAVSCVLQAAYGLEYAHRQGLVHRDVKPSNLMLDKHYVVRLLDLGLARMRSVASDDVKPGSDITESGMMLGTYDYMAPEQAEDPRAADHRADVYSLGCTLYRLLTGKLPYDRPTMVKTLLAHRHDPVPSLSEARPEVDERLEAIYRMMLAKQPIERYQSLLETIADLEAWQQGKPLPFAEMRGSTAEMELAGLQGAELVPPPINPQAVQGYVRGESRWRRHERLPLPPPPGAEVPAALPAVATPPLAESHSPSGPVARPGADEPEPPPIAVPGSAGAPGPVVPAVVPSAPRSSVSRRRSPVWPWALAALLLAGAAAAAMWFAT